MNVYLHPEALSPDPLYGGGRGSPAAGGLRATIHPRLVAPGEPAAQRGSPPDLFAPLPPHMLSPGASGTAECLLDFGTELEAELELVLHAPRAPGEVFVAFGESLPEAQGLGVPTTNPAATVPWALPRRGVHRRRFPARGFRFVRLHVPEARGPVTLRAAVAHAWFAFRERRGDFRCDDPLYQRLWQTSAYTARLCARPDGYWDGIKRDRVGWFGDARVIQLTTDDVFAEPGPAAQMLGRLPTDSWTMGIPGYTFAAVAMLHQFVRWYGTEQPGAREAYGRVCAALRWAHRTQLDASGLIRRDPDGRYFGRVAFVDWSPMPVGGDFPELSWLQCQHLEALRLAAELARWLGRAGDARAYERRAGALGRAIMRRFWRPGRGLVHTLNQTTRRWEPLVVLPLPDTVDNEYRRRYFRLPPLGESAPSRHSQTLAAWAGLLRRPAERACVRRTLGSARVPPLITAYFRYLEAVARAECGAATDAVRGFAGYLADQVVPHDSATLWEWHDPAVRGFGRWALGDWPKSLCHGWSSGLVPLTTRYVLGLDLRGPGCAALRIDPAADLPMAFEATVPTPFGAVRVERARAGAPLHYVVPRGIRVEARKDGAAVDRP